MHRRFGDLNSLTETGSLISFLNYPFDDEVSSLSKTRAQIMQNSRAITSPDFYWRSATLPCHWICKSSKTYELVWNNNWRYKWHPLSRRRFEEIQNRVSWLLRGRCWIYLMQYSEQAVRQRPQWRVLNIDRRVSAAVLQDSRDHSLAPLNTQRRHAYYAYCDGKSDLRDMQCWTSWQMFRNIALSVIKEKTIIYLDRSMSITSAYKHTERLYLCLFTSVCVMKINGNVNENW